MNIIEPDLATINAHTQDIWGCSVELPTESEKEPFVDWVSKLNDKLKASNLDADISIVLVTGCDTSNGHAFLQNRRGIAWISTSEYSSQKSIEVFVTHEVIHAIHYQNVPEYCFEKKEEKNHTGRQLITEGVATYATQVLLDVSESNALWVDYLPVNELDVLMKRYEENLSVTAEHIARDWDKTDTAYFYANDPSDVDSYRSGYYLGRLVIESVAKRCNYSLRDLLELDRNTLDGEIIREIKLLM